METSDALGYRVSCCSDENKKLMVVYLHNSVHKCESIQLHMF